MNWPDTSVDRKAMDQALAELGEHANVRELLTRAQQIKDSLKVSSAWEPEHGQRRTDDREDRPAPQPRNSETCDAGLLSGFGDALYLVLEPAVFVPSGGHVEVEAHGETAIVQIFEQDGELRESRPQCAIVYHGQEVRVIQAVNHA